MGAAVKPIQPRIRRTHLAVFVRDPVASSEWYKDVLGMEETARGEQWVFMSFGVKHHDIALIRATDRVGKGIRTSPRDALIAGSVAPEIRGRAYGFHRAMDHTGAIIGPLLCVGVVAALTAGAKMSDLLSVLRTTFLLSIVPGLLAVATLLLFVREEPNAERPRATATFTLTAFDGNFRRYLLAVAMFTLGNSSDAFLLYRVQESLGESVSLAWLTQRLPGLDAAAQRIAGAQAPALIFLPLVWSFFHIVKALLSTPFGSLSDRLGRRRIIGAGWTIYAAVYAGFAALDTFPASWRAEATLGLFMIYAVYYAFTEGPEKALVADLVPAERRGSAFGSFHFAVGAAALPASILFGFVYASYGAPVAFSMGAGIAVLATVFLAALVTERPAHPLTPSHHAGDRP